MGQPTIIPSGVTIYNKDKAYAGYTLFPSRDGARLVDMNGHVVHRWAGINGVPDRILPGGELIGSRGERNPRYSLFDQNDLVQLDYDGNIIWKFDHAEEVHDGDEPAHWVARQNHDWQREGSPCGYYSPLQTPKTRDCKTLILSHKDLVNPAISDKKILDGWIIEVDWEGNIVWEWLASDHVDEFGFDEAARNALYNDPGYSKTKIGIGDWLTINNMNYVGPNHWYNEGDERFNPNNILIDSRTSNFSAIISHETGKIVWRMGPDYTKGEDSRIGNIIGQHNVHMIPEGLPGAGNILLYDNGGKAGYGAPNINAQNGNLMTFRDYSRVIEINPVTKEIVWQHSGAEESLAREDYNNFFSPYISGAQRLPNGNTLITEGSDGRFFEVTPDHEIVWEYLNPFYNHIGKNGHFKINMVFRAYRVPYEWVPQLERPTEQAVETPDISTLRVPGSPVGAGKGKVTTIRK